MINVIIALIVTILIPVWADASPGQSGSSGLLNVPSAETLDAGNICVGVWTCYSQNSYFSRKSSMIMPVTITLGIGTFWEVYGTYPNILFNGDDDVSGRGTLDLGTKLRFLGGRSSDLKVAVDFLGQHHVSESKNIDGVTDLSARLIASYNKNDFGIHLFAGYLKPGSVSGGTMKPGYTFGAGVEYMVIPRLKFLGEVTGSTNRYYIEDDTAWASPKIFTGRSMEASFGVQYYLSPHFTLNASAGTGFGVNDSDEKFLFGISSCQGIGTYVKPIPAVGRRATVADKAKEALKPLKIIPISSLLLKASAPQSAPVSKLEVELEAENEEVLIKPYGQIAISPQQASSNLTSPVIPVEMSLKTRDEVITLQPQNPGTSETGAVDYTLGRLQGVSPLFGVDVKGTQVAIPVAVSLPERMVVHRKFIYPDVAVDYGEWTLSSNSKKMLAEVAEQIRKDKKVLYIRIDGHTDAIGSLSYNMDLSLKRSIAAASYLISNEGIEPAKIFVKGFGKSSPIAENDTAAGRSKNRRTEILFLVPRESP